jgi:hypothetical protein
MSRAEHEFHASSRTTNTRSKPVKAPPADARAHAARRLAPRGWLALYVGMLMASCAAPSSRVEVAASAQALSGSPNIGATCAPDRADACPSGQVCVAENIAELGERWSCQLACTTDADCDVFTPKSERDCVHAFRAHGKCRCSTGTPFASCERASESGPTVCQSGVFQAYADQPPCL